MNKEIKKPQNEKLSHLVVKGGAWSFLLKSLQVLLQVIKLIILARVLNPRDFGLMGIALLTIAVLETFSGTGFQSALIQKKENIKPYLDSAWTVAVLRGLVLFTTLFIIAPYAGRFFDSPGAVPIIKIVGLTLLIRAFSNVAVVYFRKEMQFNKEFLYLFGGSIVDFVVSVCTALIFKNIWALVFGLLAGHSASLILGYVIYPYRPRIDFNLKIIKGLFSFGKWVLGSSIVIFLATHGDDAFLGKVLGVTMLGFYQLAFRIGNTPSSEITGIINRVLFPAYAKIQDDTVRLKEAYFRVLTLIMLFVVPLVVGIVIFSPEFIRIFLGTKWLPMKTPLQILAIAGFFRAVAGTSGPVFHALGKPVLDFKVNLIRVLVIICSIYPLTMAWKINGTSLSVLLGIIAASGFCFYILNKEINLNYQDFLETIIPPLASSLCMGIICLFLLRNIGGTNYAVGIFLLTVVLALIVYFGVISLISKKSKYNGLKGIKFILKRS